MDVTLRHIHKTFGQISVLRNLSATFPGGRITSLMGPSGCGKTTLLRLLMGLEVPDSGEILGTHCAKAAVFQENRLFQDFSPLSNLSAVLPRPIRQDQLVTVLHQLGLGDFVHAPVSSLSGGMQRRVALARGMLAPAELVLLDEPFTGLDAQNKATAMAFIKTHAVGKTIVLVTHDTMECSYFGGEILTLPAT